MEDTYYNRSTCFPNEVDTPENPAIQSAMIIMDYEGRVVGTVGRIGEKTENRSWNISTMSKRHPGSTIKPLSCYAPAIELNEFYWSSQIPNYGINIPGEPKAISVTPISCLLLMKLSRRQRIPFPPVSFRNLRPRPVLSF